MKQALKEKKKKINEDINQYTHMLRFMRLRECVQHVKRIQANGMKE